MHDAKGPLLAIWARGWELAGLTSDTQLAAYLARPDQRTFDLADLTIRYLKRELKVEGTPEVDRRRPAGARLRRRRLGREGRGRGVDGPGPGGDRPGRRAGRGDRGAQRHQPAATGSSCRCCARWPGWSRPGWRSTSTTWRPWSRSSTPRSTRPPSEAYAVLGKQINLGSPKQLQVVLFDELGMPKTRRTRTGYTTDAEALQSLYVKTEHPFLAHLLRAPRRHPAPADGRGTAEVHRGRRPDPHHVRADHRGHRAAVQHRPQPAEHPDPHRGGTADPAGVRGRRRLRVADDGRLLADRDADHGPRQRGRGPDRGVQVGHGLPHRHRVAGVRRRARRR